MVKPHSGPRLRLLPLAFALPLLALGMPGSGARAQSSAETPLIAVSLAAQPLGQALNDIARLGKLQLLASPDLLMDKTAPPVSGRMTVREALDRVLAGSGLVAVTEGEATIIHRAPASGTTTVLPAVVVHGTAPSETAATPVDGYIARRSTVASKTDTPLIESPESVTIVTRDQMTDLGAQNVQDALNYAAGVRSDAYGLDAKVDWLKVRGSAPDRYQDGLRQTFGEVTRTSPRTEPYTLERIEVLRGPGAMLYGQGSTAGIVNLASKLPQPVFRGEVGLQVGTYDHKQIQADLTGPLTDDGRLTYRLIALKRDAGTQVDHVNNDRQLFAPSLTWRPGAATSWTFRALWQTDRTKITAQNLPWAGMLTANPNGRIPTRRFLGEPDSDHFNSKYRSFGWSFEHAFNETWKFRQNLRFDHNERAVREHYPDFFSTPGDWAQDPIDKRRILRFVGQDRTNVHQLAVDQNIIGSFSAGGIGHTVLAGLDLARYRQTSASAVAEEPDLFDAYAPVYGQYTPLELSPDPRNRQRQMGAYLQYQARLGASWSLIAGLRHDRVVSSVEGSDDAKNRATTRRLGLMYAIGNGWSPYLNYSESFLPLAGLDFYNNRYKPLRGKQTEAGIKYESASGDLQFNAAAYHLKERNQLTEDPTNPLNSIQTGRTTNRGVELELKAAVNARLALIAFYTYIDVDRQLEGTPRHQAALWGKWRFGPELWDGLSTGAGIRWLGQFNDGDAPTTPSVTLLDAVVAYETGRWRYALNVNNLLDKTYVSICMSRGDCWFGSRRNAVLSASYRF